MKNPCMIHNIGPQLLTDYSVKPSYPLQNLFGQNKGIWITVLAVLFCICLGMAHAQSSGSDRMVMKVYPDGTKVLVPWSDIGKSFDEGKNFGGAPKILPYDPSKDGIVPIGQTSKQNQSTATNPALPASTSVVTPEQPAKMDYSESNPDNYDNFGPKEGFVLRSAAGVAFQQPLSGRSGGQHYLKYVFAPGIRYDLEAEYDVTEWFRTGVETSFIYNQIHSATVDSNTFYNSSRPLGNGGLFQVPTLYNMSFHFPSEGPFRGYFGAGLGANWNVLQLSHDGQRPYTSYHWNWAYQLTTGFTYALAEGLDLDISYKMLSMTNPNFADSGQFKPSYNHSAEVGLVWRF